MHIGPFEAKNRFGHLLDLGGSGEKVTMTRHGRDVARPIPACASHDSDEARAAIERIRQRAAQLKLGRFNWPDWKSYRDEDRPRALVLDSLVTLAWVCGDQTTPAIRQVFEGIA